MVDIKIHKKNELYLYLEFSDKGIAYELNDVFSFFVPGYKYMPKFKSGIWDGKIKLFNIKDKTFLSGLIIDLIRFCDKYGYSYELVDNFKLVNLKNDLIEFKNNITNISKLSIEGEYQFQFIAVEQLCKYQKALLKSPTGSGKSNIIYMLVRFFLEVEENDILICVPAVSLVNQLFENFKEFVNDDFDVDDSCHKIYAGQSKLSEKRIVITTWQSIYKLPESWFKRFGVFICDEAHQADGNSLKAIINNLTHTKYRFGLTGTLADSKTHELVLRGLFGPIINPTSTKKLMDLNVLANLSIQCEILRYSKEDITIVRKRYKTYADEIEWLIKNDKRNKFIIDKAFSQSNNTLVLFNFIEGHGEKLFDMAKEKAIEFNKQVFFIHGNINIDERERIRKIAEINDNIIIFASYGTFSQGINIKNLHCVIFAHPFKSKIRNLQSIGRVLRKYNTKTKAILIDIGDDLSLGNDKNIVFLHFIERLKIYENEEFDYTINKRNI